MYNREKVFNFHLACSEDKQDLFTQIAEQFNRVGYTLEDGRLLRLQVHFYDSETVIRSALGRDFAFICPESTLELHELEEQWQEHHYEEAAVASSFTFATTPIVLVIHPRVAQQIGYPERQIGWRTLQMAVNEFRNLKLMHAHGQTVDGKLIAVAEFIAAAGQEQKHLEMHDRTVLSFVRSLEAATAEYGPTDQEVILRALAEGEWQADIIVAQERNVLRMLPELSKLQAVLVYPKEGTIWADHPLAACRRESDLSINTREVEPLSPEF